MGRTLCCRSCAVLALQRLKRSVLWSKTRVSNMLDRRLQNESTPRPCLRGVPCCLFPSFLAPFVIFAAQSPNCCLRRPFQTHGSSVCCGTMLPLHLPVLACRKDGTYCWLSWRSWFQVRFCLQVQLWKILLLLCSRVWAPWFISAWYSIVTSFMRYWSWILCSHSRGTEIIRMCWTSMLVS